MPGPKPAVPRARPSGGINPDLGAAPHEHLDESALQTAVGHKQQQQQTGTTTPGQTARSQQQHAQHQHPTAQAAQPRSVGTLKQELLGRPLEDIGRGFKSFIDINALLGINYDDPQVQTKQRQLHQRWQKLTDDEQEYARRVYQEKIDKQRHEEEDQAKEKEAKEAQDQQPVAAPSAHPKGPVGLTGLSRKKQTAARIQHQRQTLSTPRGSS